MKTKKLNLTWERTEPVNPVLIFTNGGGLNSMAHMILLRDLGITPDAVLFADTGAEKIDTYLYISLTMRPWMKANGWPELTIVRHTPAQAPYRSLFEKCWKNHTVPSLAFGKGECSMTWKHGAMDRWVDEFEPAHKAWAAGNPTIRAIGYDAGEADLRRRAKSGKKHAEAPVTISIGYDAGEADLRRATKAKKLQVDQHACDGPVAYWYPLQDEDIDRAGCEDLVRAEGLPIPQKSACFFCPAMHRDEIAELAQRDPTQYQIALGLDKRYRDSKHYRGPEARVQGLGINRSWNDIAAEDGLPEYDGTVLHDEATGRAIYELPVITRADEAPAGCRDCPMMLRLSA